MLLRLEQGFNKGHITALVYSTPGTYFVDTVCTRMDLKVKYTKYLKDTCAHRLW